MSETKIRLDKTLSLKCEYLSELQNLLPNFINPGFFRKHRSAQQFAEYAQFVATAKCDLWYSIHKAYPQYADKSLTVTNSYLIVEDAEIAGDEPAGQESA